MKCLRDMKLRVVINKSCVFPNYASAKIASGPIFGLIKSLSVVSVPISTRQSYP